MNGVNPLKVFGLWLLYAVAGLLIAVFLAGNEVVDLHEGGKPKTRYRTQIVGGVSGLLLVVGTLGWFFLHDPAAGGEGLARVMAVVGWAGGAMMIFVEWWMIAHDLRHASS